MKEKVFYLITVTKTGKNEIIHDVRDAEKLGYYGGRCSSIGRPYKTRQELIDGEKILDKPCKKCGGIVKASFLNGDKLIENNLCFSCDLWNDRLIELKSNKNIIICNSVWYTIVPENNDKNKYRGHGGRLFIFKKLDNNEIVKSTNVWCGGDIPSIYLDELRDNATLL